MQKPVYRIFTILFLIFLNYSPAFSQFENYKQVVELSKKRKVTEKVVDSILKTYTNRGKSYANIAHSFSFFFYRIKRNYDLAIKYGIIEKNTFENLRLNNKEYNNILYNLGKYHFLKFQYTKAINYFEQAIKSNQFPKKVAQSYCQLGRCYRALGDYYKSLNHYSLGLPLLLKVGSKQSYIAHSRLLAATCNKLNTKESVKLGLFYLEKADSIAGTLTNRKAYNQLFYEINTTFANLYALKHQYNFEKAKHFYKKNIALANKEKNHKELALNFLNLGELYLNKNKDSALAFLHKSLFFDRKNLFKFETCKNLARFYSRKKQYQKAIDLYTTA
ncbi:tetratricopeptide repeat protein [Tenacibaculum sp. MAR_2009_124]|uniref:tetratricopeptide repeat protein n=1 Tax=Tenacibaculum sp. MAR_2009_124 TaxID=1250059 RepID=UPI000B835187|nr:tetratricopeptide repeat protein [Tenacibaculum sp. MAR_2009_124]